jgi:hypothetical protein
MILKNNKMRLDLRNLRSYFENSYALRGFILK